MNQTGLVSVSFRQLVPEQIISLVKKAGLDGIEWGGDIHVPHGDLSAAQQVKKQTLDAGLQIFSYGSYYRTGTYADPVKEWEPVLAAARVLEAPVIRIWAYDKPSQDVGEEQFQKIVREVQLLADLAGDRIVAFECHPNTLTDHYKSALRLVDAIGRKNVRMYWQPNQNYDEAYNLAALDALLPHIEIAHIFQWDAAKRYPLSAGKRIWQKYLTQLEKAPHAPRLLLEFMYDNAPASLCQEAAVLKEMLVVR